ncbi:conserved hypothetical protein [Caldicellulosiruptor hydrothermalis 108]|uniref:Uncharacterized protein n=1 Tax=Caldicellulosiruptor hydrothermalis (strain DSM 18901 / VKM B-2411 / 108) TaxID=632292 RepID=E4QBG0_CALH1|nr:hypothetical protein [Caldicellulosiruptor hydrothermalis]ADQ06062.1 conserved hypothetical protein [Caldicellulosiruptor hydrothermalis 108]
MTKFKKLKFSVLAVLSGLFLFYPVVSFAGPVDIGKTFITSLSNKIVYVGIGFVVIAFMLAFLKLMFTQNEQEHAQTAQWLKYIVIACIILGIFTSIIGVILGFEQKFTDAMKVLPSTQQGSQPVNQADTDKTMTWIGLALTWIINYFIQLIEWIGRLAGFKPLNQLLFNNTVFSDKEFKFLLTFYSFAAACSIAFVVLMVGKTAIQLTVSGLSVRKRVNLMEEITTWFQVVLLIAAAPLLFSFMFWFFEKLTNWLYAYVKTETTYFGNVEGITASVAKFFGFGLDENKIAQNGFIDTLALDLGTSNPLNTAIVKLIYALLYFKVNLIFLTRRIILGVFFLFTPFAAAMWGIKKDANVMNVWFGEIITNASMAFFYAFTLLAVLHLFTAVGLDGWLFGAIAMYSVPKIADTLRNLLQNYFERLSGIDEMSLANPFFSGTLAMMKGAQNSFVHAFGSQSKASEWSTSIGSTSGGEINAGGLAGGFSPAGGGSGSGGSGATFAGFTGSRTFEGGPIPMGGFSGVPATGGPKIEFASTSGSTTSGSSASPLDSLTGYRNIYTDTDATRKAFLRNLNAMTGGSKLYRAGQFLQGVGETLGRDNPTFQAFSYFAGGIMKSAGSINRIGQAIDLTTLERMSHMQEYKQHFANLAPVVNKLTAEGKYGVVMDAIRKGDVSILAMNGVTMTDEISNSVLKLSEAFKGEREITKKQLGINEVIAAKKLGHGYENFERYFARKHPYKDAAEAFIFKV